MKRDAQVVLVWLLLATSMVAVGAAVEGYGRQVAGLIDPGKLATLRDRGANPRVQRYVALLAEAARENLKLGKLRSEMKAARVAAQAVALVGMKGEAANSQETGGWS